jgi:small subunit ribosomal protein S8
MLTRIRNAVQVRHETVDVPVSRIRADLLKLLQSEGFIAGFEKVEKTAKAPEVFRVKLNYHEDREPVIQGLQRVSKPGLRVYVGKNEIPRYFGGLGVSFMSTPQGIMTGQQARRSGTGGELLFYVW